MKARLTKKDIAGFKKNLMKVVDAEYKSALKSGAFPENYDCPHEIFRIAIQRAAAQFAPITPEGRALMRNYENF